MFGHTNRVCAYNIRRRHQSEHVNCLNGMRMFARGMIIYNTVRPGPRAVASHTPFFTYVYDGKSKRSSIVYARPVCPLFFSPSLPLSHPLSHPFSPSLFPLSLSLPEIVLNAKVDTRARPIRGSVRHARKVCSSGFRTFDAWVQ